MEFGLIGKTLKYSESANIFNKYYIDFQLSKHKFQLESTPDNQEINFINPQKSEKYYNSNYTLFELENIDELDLLLTKKPNLRGFNVTIPYKTEIIPRLFSTSENAQQINAVNCVKIIDNNLYGYNTDWLAFMSSLQNFKLTFPNWDNPKNFIEIFNLTRQNLEKHFLNKTFSQNDTSKLLFSKIKKALILGTGGAAKAVAYTFKKLNIEFVFATRKRSSNTYINYNELSENYMSTIGLIVNTTPCGTDGLGLDLDDVFDFDLIPQNIYLYDLIYNPRLTPFLLYGRDKKNCIVKNGMEMLYLQAIYSWWIWNNNY